MCGIVGALGSKSDLKDQAVRARVFSKLIRLSQSRGRDSSGVARLSADGFDVVKSAIPAHALLREKEVRNLLKPALGLAGWIGHSRMETDGSFLSAANNQPIAKGASLLLHNGIIVNARELWETTLTGIQQQSDVDSEVLLELCLRGVAAGALGLPQLKNVEGSYTLVFANQPLGALWLATNTGSLYIAQAMGSVYFASEKIILTKALKGLVASYTLKQLPAGDATWISFRDTDTPVPSDTQASGGAGASSQISVRINPLDRRQERIQTEINIQTRGEIGRLVEARWRQVAERVAKLRRCGRCVLPETMPFIHFDAQGVCNYCHEYRTQVPKGRDALNLAIRDTLRNKSGPNCILSFSGGRDSSYALHYAVKELGLKPVAFSYDWGMLTDLGRRNQARMTGALGVEHVLVASDIQRKRKNIQRNVLAWLNKPHLGTVPLFMAGDKHYFYHLNRLQGVMDIPLLVYASNSLESTGFKYGFAGVRNDPYETKTYGIGLGNSFKLLSFFGKEFLSNPGYLNPSLLDSFTAYLSSYFTSKEYLYLFQYIPWVEEEVDRTLLGQYNWEVAADSQSTWRIGDGTQAFYNLIYYWGAGLTEYDTFRSNQVREGAITREQAMAFIAEGNQPRVDSLVWYFNTIGIDGLAAIKRIQAMQGVVEWHI